MGLITLYLGITFVGYFVGSKLRKKDIKWTWTSKVQLVCITLLVFTMGSRIGADEKVMGSLDTIGLTAIILTVFVMVGSVLAVFIARKLMKIDKEGVKIDD